MRAVAALLILALLGATAALHFGSGSPSSSALDRKARSLSGVAEAMTLERAADYWLGEGQRQQSAGRQRGSGVALALAIRLGRAEALRQGVRPVPEKFKEKVPETF